jgi:hypothetical protein
VSSRRSEIEQDAFRFGLVDKSVHNNFRYELVNARREHRLDFRRVDSSRNKDTRWSMEPNNVEELIDFVLIQGMCGTRNTELQKTISKT